MKRIIVFGIVSLLLISIVYAEESSVEKNLTFFQKIKLWFAFSDESKAKLYLNFANEEIEKSIKNPNKADEHLLKAKNYIGKSVSKISGIQSEKRENIMNFGQKLSEQILKIEPSLRDNYIKNKITIMLNSKQVYDDFFLNKEYNCNFKSKLLNNPNNCINRTEKSYINTCDKSVMLELEC